MDVIEWVFLAFSPDDGNSQFLKHCVLLRKLHIGQRPEISYTIAQTLSHQPLTTNAQVHTQVSPCGICGRQSDAGTGSSLSPSVLPC
jgi:hypothetical protein